MTKRNPYGRTPCGCEGNMRNMGNKGEYLYTLYRYTFIPLYPYTFIPLTDYFLPLSDLLFNNI